MVPHPSSIDVKELNHQLPENDKTLDSSVEKSNTYEQTKLSEIDFCHNNQSQLTPLVETSTDRGNILNHQLPANVEIPVSGIANPNISEQFDTSEMNFDRDDQAQLVSLVKTSTNHRNVLNAETSNNGVSDLNLNKNFSNRFVNFLLILQCLNVLE